ncbi:MAG: heparinase II/III family protein [Rhizobiales bacterium]|nr:heparinase II/III family protein [Hyphomicrobiales bacterium]
MPRFFRQLLDLPLGRTKGGGPNLVFRGLAQPLPPPADGDAAIAQALYRGTFTFAGMTVECQPSEVFSVGPPNEAWDEALTGFSWLTHLAAPDLALYRAFARNLVQCYAVSRRRSSFTASAHRLVALARHAGFLLSGASAGFETFYMELAARETRRFAAATPRTVPVQLLQAVALLNAGLAFRGGESLRDEALGLCAALTPALILPDGGPADRNPASLLAFLNDFLPLRLSLERQRASLPRELHGALERALPMLQMLCHGDDGLAVFQGVTRPEAKLVRTTLSLDAVQGRPLAHAPQSGYCRMTQGGSCVIADCGKPAQCDSALALEFSDGPYRVVTSCGLPEAASPAWKAAASLPAAHSTLVLGAGARDRIQSFFTRRARRLPADPVGADVIASPHGTLLKAWNALSATASGLVHHRELFLAAGGQDFRGEDRLERCDRRGSEWPAASFAIRFHLHPTVKASLDRKGTSVALVLPNRDVWQFSARGGGLSLEDSIFLATGGAARVCEQIVIRGMAGRPERVNWAFKKLAGNSP